MSLTDTWLDNMKGKTYPKVKEYADRDGMSVRISPKGKIIFQMRYLYKGKAQRLDLGTYPHLSLKKARKENDRLRGKLSKGHDPKVVQRVERAEITDALTLVQLYEQWHEAVSLKTKKNAIPIKRSFELHLFPSLGDLPVDSIPDTKWFEVLSNLIKNKPATGDRILSNSKQMLDWGKRLNLVKKNAVKEYKGAKDFGFKRKRRKRCLKKSEIGLLVNVMPKSRMKPTSKAFVLLCLLFGCRCGELRQSRKSDFDFKKMIWTVPPENHKTGEQTEKPIIRPLIPEIVPMLKEIMNTYPDSVWMFTEGKEVLNRGSVTNYSRRLKESVKAHTGIEMEHWSIHDLRRTARTNIGDFADPYIGEMMLGHALPGEWGTYDLNTYLKKQRKAYSKWWKRIQKCAEKQGA